ncbi:UNVERIFIED_CONTAM: hypothetical protein Sradi_1745000 [Sesamum radiatum]|uniref:Integrase zinc-binding domain-containing protein n=1 Tax=Sesamum radiatum TaxID=300843 RepID=A0AAW2TX80_SESRA
MPRSEPKEKAPVTVQLVDELLTVELIPSNPGKVTKIGSHIGTWALANKALRAGYFWPTMKQDARYLVNNCEKCQKHATLINQPVEPLNIMLSPYPFFQWGMNIVRPFLLTSGQRKFLLVTIGYFTKW